MLENVNKRKDNEGGCAGSRTIETYTTKLNFYLFILYLLHIYYIFIIFIIKKNHILVIVFQRLVAYCIIATTIYLTTIHIVLLYTT